jgi:hypothetical protein
MHLLIVQYSGDYREAVNNFAQGKEETYYAQRYSVDSVAQLTQSFGQVTVLCCMTSEAYDQVLPNGIRAIGAGFKSGRVPMRQLIGLMERLEPTHLISRMSDREIFDWAIDKKIKTMALLAASVLNQNWRDRWRNYLLARSLNHPQIEWIGSYGINASLGIREFGVNPEKIIPWDFILESTPGSLPAKTLRTEQGAWTLFFVGSMMEGKGVNEILQAVALLKQRQIPVHLKLAGKDATGFYQRQVAQLEIKDRVEFLGLIANQTVEPLMRDADVVLIPSRHNYPEGFPLTIHHALRSRTPIVASDHPMFKNKLEHGVSAMIFPAGNAVALADQIAVLLADAQLYAQLSEASYETWSRLRLPVKWGDVLEKWLHESPENRQWLYDHRLTSGLYKISVPTTVKFEHSWFNFFINRKGVKTI